MFYLNTPMVVDSAKNVVGYIVNGRFTQDDFFAAQQTKSRIPKVSMVYDNGLSPRELEAVSELLQRSENARKRT